MKLNIGDKVIWKDYKQTELILRGKVTNIVNGSAVIQWENGRIIEYTPDMLINEKHHSLVDGKVKLDVQSIRNDKLEQLGIEEHEPHCYICYSKNVEPEMVCDICEELYCEECSYTFSLHYQHEGARCYSCADQRRRTPLNKRDVRINKVLLK